LCVRLRCPGSVAVGAGPGWVCVNYAPEQRRSVLRLVLRSKHGPIGARELPGVPARDHLPCDLAQRGRARVIEELPEGLDAVRVLRGERGELLEQVLQRGWIRRLEPRAIRVSRTRAER